MGRFHVEQHGFHIDSTWNPCGIRGQGKDLLTGSSRVLRINGQLPLADEPQVNDQGNADGSGGHARLHHAYQEQDMDETEIWDDFYTRLLARSQNRERRGGEHGDDTGDFLGDDTGSFLGDDTDNILWELGCLVCDLSFTEMNFNLNCFSQDVKSRSAQNSAGNKRGLCAYSPSHPRTRFCGSCL